MNRIRRSQGCRRRLRSGRPVAAGWRAACSDRLSPRDTAPGRSSRGRHASAGCPGKPPAGARRSARGSTPAPAWPGPRPAAADHRSDGPPPPPRTFPGASMGQVPVIDAAVVRAHVTAQLPANCRRRASQPGGDHPDSQAVPAQGRDPLPVQQQQLTARPGRLGQPHRGHRRCPPATGTRSCGRCPPPCMPQPPDTGQQRLPVQRLRIQLPLTPTPRHQHAPHLTGVLRQALEPKRHAGVSVHPPPTASTAQTVCHLRLVRLTCTCEQASGG